MNEPFITILAAIGGFLGKSLWDFYWSKRRDYESLARKHRLDFIERQLKEFYWPLYIRLQKNNAVWDHLVRTYWYDHPVSSTVNTELQKTFFLPNHDEIVRIIENHIHLAQANEELTELLRRFLQHVTLFKALRSSGIDNVDPVALGVPWPKELFGAIEKRTKELQAKFDREIGQTKSEVEPCPKCRKRTWEWESSHKDSQMEDLSMIWRVYKCSACGFSEKKPIIP